MRSYKTIALESVVEPAAPMRFALDDAKFNELVESVKQQGILEPLLVKPRGDVYEVIAGHRRLLAARVAGLSHVPCVVFEGEENNELAIMLDENVIREDVSPVEEGELYLKVWALPGMTEEAIQKRTGKTMGYINARIDLVNGDPEIALAVHNKHIVLGVARELNKVKNEGYRRMYLARAVQGGCTIEQAHTWVANWRMSDSGVTPAQAQPMEPLPGPEHIGLRQRCRFCGSDDDQHELEPIWVHRGELYAVLGSIERAKQAAVAPGGD